MASAHPTTTKSAPLTLPLTVTLRPETYQKLATALAGQEAGPALAAQAQHFLEARADGAILLKTEDIAKIEAATHQTIGSAKDIVTAALKGVAIEDGARIYRFPIDPEFEGPLQEQATAAGVRPEDLIEEIIFKAIENNWVLSLNFEGHSRLFSPRAEQWFAQLLGNPGFTVQDIEHYIQQHQPKSHDLAKASAK